MTNAEAIELIVKTMELLDVEIDYLKVNGKNCKHQSMKLWFEEKKAIYEVKRLLHEIGQYDKYNEAETDQIIQGYLAQSATISV
ncbi:hypothetical protein [Enterococcus ureasiticus]|uniref:Uncharacterized protein n=1 Tax=Enterococcus ureasiticus TaxID=903984 RepID=A0A1E5GB94_9ENTE|nr:hypothetical protein [Enterococcus ureasiticus]OEG09530.1 hypothetical protein BCR21_14355 [Enterococcus ureasiticus]